MLAVTEMINDMKNSTQYTPFLYQSRGGNIRIITHFGKTAYEFMTHLQETAS